MSYSLREEDDGVLWCTISTVNLDAGYCIAHAKELREAVSVEKPVVLELSNVEFADGAGLGLIRRLSGKLRGSLRLANVGVRLERCLARLPSDCIPPIFHERETQRHVGPGKARKVESASPGVEVRVANASN